MFEYTKARLKAKRLPDTLRQAREEAEAMVEAWGLFRQTTARYNIPSMGKSRAGKAAGREIVDRIHTHHQQAVEILQLIEWAIEIKRKMDDTALIPEESPEEYAARFN